MKKHQCTAEFYHLILSKMLAIENKKEVNTLSIRFSNIDGLRFLAALMVFFHHLFSIEIEKFGNLKENPVYIKIRSISNIGHYGVSIFFVISGFLIFSHLLNEYQKTNTIAWGKFWMRRILRIWPLYFFLVIFGFFIFPNLPFGKSTLHQFKFFASFLSNFDEIWWGAKDPLNFLTITWSISVEEQFYYGTILVFLILSAKLFYKYGLYLFITMVLLSVLFKHTHFELERLVYYHTLSNMIYLSLGAIMAFLNKNQILQHYVNKVSRKHVIQCYITSLILLALMLVFRKKFSVISDLTIGICFSIFILFQAFSNYSIIPLDKIYGFKKAGEITYGFYIFHALILYYLSNLIEFFKFYDSWLFFILYGFSSFILTYMIAFISYHYFESPFLRLKNQFRNNSAVIR